MGSPQPWRDIMRPAFVAVSLLAAGCSNGTAVLPSLDTSADKLLGDKSPAALLRVADAARAAGDPATAIGLYQRAHALASGDPVPLARLGATLADLQSYTEAADAYRQALAIAPDDLESQRGLGAVFLAMNRPDLALAQLAGALAKKEDARIYSLIGVAYDLTSRHDLAQQNYAAGLKLAPDDLGLRNNLGLSQALGGDFTAAIGTLNTAVTSPSANAKNRQNLAMIYALAGDMDKSATLARIDLDETAVKNNLSYYTLLRGMDDQSRAAAIIGARMPAGAVQQRAPVQAQRQEMPITASLPAMPVVEAMPLEAPAALPVDHPAPVAANQHAPLASRPKKKVALTAANPTPATDSPVAKASNPADSAPVGPRPADPAQAAPATIQPEAKADPIPAAPASTSAPASPAPLAARQPEATPVKPAETASTATTPPTESHDAPAADDQSAASAGVSTDAASDQSAAAPHQRTARGHGHFLVQVGAFHDADRAQKLYGVLSAKGYELAIVPDHGESAQKWYFVRSSAALGHEEAASLADRIRTEEGQPAMLIPGSVHTSSARS